MVQNNIHCHILLLLLLVRLQVLTQTPRFVLLAVKKSERTHKQSSSYVETECIGNTDDFFPCVALLEAAKRVRERERRERGR